MQLSSYLDRIDASGAFEPSFQNLVTLHELHMSSVPFENLDIPLGREIVMNEERFLDKIVRQRRGGFCYELNGAFAWVLRQLEFEVTYLSACVIRADGTPGPDFDHMALLVEIGGERWIADVGFGDSFSRPLKLVADEVQTDADPRRIVYRLSEEGGRWSMWKRERGDDAPWSREYTFTLAARALDEYAPMCRHQQVSPESSFTKKIVCSKTTADGRITLTATTLIETTASGRVETPVAREEWYDVLRDRFGVVLPGRIERWPREEKKEKREKRREKS